MHKLLLLALGIAALSGASSAAPPDTIPPGLAARTERGEVVRAIVSLRVPFAPEGELPESLVARQRAEILEAQRTVLEALAGAPHRVRRSFGTVPALAVELGPGALAALSRSPWVREILEDEPVPPSLDGTVPLIGAAQLAAAGHDGSGQAVVVLDTGVDAEHPNLAGKLVDEACFASLGAGPNGDCPNGRDTQFGSGAGRYCTYSTACDHGTHVAGIAVGDGPEASGVARGASLVSIQVASAIPDAGDCSPLAAPCPQSLTSDQIAALEYVYTTLRHAHDIASVNLSFSGGGYTSQASCDAANAAIKGVIDNLRSVGIPTVISAGNGGQSDAIGAPGCVSSAVSVGATHDSDLVWSSSSAASFLSLWAPGVAVRAPRWQSTGYTSKSGTSMASPHVAGAFAILRQVDGTSSVSRLLSLLQQTGAPIDHPTAATTRIDVLAALQALTPDCDDGLDNDGDGLVDVGDDPGCDDALDGSERSSALACDDGVDNDGDGLIDHTLDGDADGVADPPGDPSCVNALAGETRRCQDGLDDDGDGLVDWDGGLSIWGEGHPNVTQPDPQCIWPWRDSESLPARCGLGFELVLLMVPAAGWRSRRRARARAS